VPTRRIPTARPIDLRETLGPLRRGAGDPTMVVGPGEVARASRTPGGPGTIRLTAEPGGIRAQAWGPGAGWLLEHAAAWSGALDDDGFDPPSGVVRDLHRRHPGLRIPRTGLVLERLIPVILEQKVTSEEARRSYRRLARALAEPAPGPLRLSLPPDPARVAALPWEDFHPFGVERRRAMLLREVARRAAWFDGAAALPIEGARRRLGLLPGIGPWSGAEVARTALGDGDSVSVGDYHVPNIVAWALAGEPRGTDERMLELLAPFAPHRGRVQRLLEVSRIRPPAFGPRMEIRAIDGI
jgi:3-methyladenine DNA glycosylase/8-oxoguanine DNA glycosylase